MDIFEERRVDMTQHRIILKERIEEHGNVLVDLFLELDDRIYRSAKRYINKKERSVVVAECFKEIARYLEHKEKS